MYGALLTRVRKATTRPVRWGRSATASLAGRLSHVPRRARVTTRLVGVTIGVLVLTALVLMATEAVADVTGVIATDSAWYLVLQTAVQSLALGVLSLVYLTAANAPARRALRLTPPSPAAVGGGIAAGVGLVGVLMGVTALAQVVPMMSPPAEHAVTETLSANTAALVAFLVCLPVLFVPAEEILFRGVIQTRLKGVWSQRSSIAIAALIFTLIHAPAFAGPGMGAALIVVGISGLALGVALEWTNSLVTPILLHTTYNVAVLLPLLL